MTPNRITEPETYRDNLLFKEVAFLLRNNQKLHSPNTQEKISRACKSVARLSVFENLMLWEEKDPDIIVHLRQVAAVIGDTSSLDSLAKSIQGIVDILRSPAAAKQSRRDRAATFLERLAAQLLAEVLEEAA